MKRLPILSACGADILRTLDRERKLFGPEHPQTAKTMSLLGLCLLGEAKWAEAEAALRECLKIREAKLPDDWSRFNAMSQLGGALLGQKKYPEAEPLIVQGYEGMKVREARIPPQAKPRLAQAAERVVRLYEAWGKPDQAAAWRAKLGRDWVPSELPAEVFARP